MRNAVCACFLIIIGLPSLSFGDQPLESLQKGIDAGIRILDDPIYARPDTRDHQQQRLWEVTRQIFDFEEFSKRVLASHWKAFTPTQRQEFVNVFGEFLARFYLSKVQEKYRDERVIYLSQKLIGRKRALVEIKVLWKDMEVPVKIRMIKRSGLWKAYDVNVFGVSAVKNYRAQFKTILSTQSPREVINRLKKKVAELGETSS